MVIYNLSSKPSLLAGSSMSLGATQGEYGDMVDEYNETDGGWEQ